jgi:hypothetical protein
MGTRGTVYLVRVPREDGGWITFQTCDRLEAIRLAARFHVDVELRVLAQRVG